MELALAAFWQLSTCRTLGFGVVGRIPWTAVRDYLEHLGVADDELVAGDYCAWIGALDDEYLALQTEEMERRGKQKPAKVPK